MNDWGNPVPALLGSKGGVFEEYFVFVADASVREIHDALVALGARARVVYTISESTEHMGYRKGNTPADYMQGDPVQISIEWRDKGEARRKAYEDFFLEKVTVNGVESKKPWTPHFVFHGSGILNDKKTGCLACTHDCPGGIIGNNQFPLIDPVPVLKADWDLIPSPGSKITIEFRPVASGIR